MSHPSLTRQTTQSGFNPASSWLADLYALVNASWKNAQRCFPEFFRGDIEIDTIEVRPGSYIGIAKRHKVPGEPQLSINNLETVISFETPGIALGEICLMAREAIHTMIRHLLYCSNLQFDISYEEAALYVAQFGRLPTAQDDSDSDHVRVLSPRPVR